MTDLAPARFVPGLELNRQFYHAIVAPLLARHCPGLAYSAALIGSGSDVLGYDTERSTDHMWGPRLQIFLAEPEQSSAVDTVLRAHLPPTFAGYSVHFSPPDWSDNGVRHPEEHSGGPVNHLLEITTVTEFFDRYLALDLNAPLTAVDWLALPEQKLLEVTSGAVFHDGLGTLEPARARFAYYPDDLWRCRLAAQWGRISEEEAFMGRCGELGDELGSRVVMARLARDLMRLTFLYSRRYAPYSKWLGTAFLRLPLGPRLEPLLLAALKGGDWRVREEPWVSALAILAEEHNRQGLTTHVDPAIQLYFDRPYRVLFCGRFAEALAATLADPHLRTLATTMGGIDQFVDSTAVQSDAQAAARLRAVYTALAETCSST